ncbi:unnamed protein product [Closterium sp. NIES-53]
MASLSVLTYDHEGRPIQFDTWLDDVQLYLLSNSRDSVSLFDHTSGASLAPSATADSATRSQWLTRDAAAHLAVRNHLPLAGRAHFGQHKTAKALYDAVVAHYSSPATAALGRLLLPYLFPELSAFATVEDLITHLCTSDARYRAALPGEFLDRNLPSMYITLYFIVTRLPDSVRAVSDHFLALDPTGLTVDLLEQHLLAAETSVVALGAVRGTRTPFFEGKGKGGTSGGGGSGGGGGGGSRGGGGNGGGGSGGSGGGSGGFGGGGGGSGGGDGSDSSGSGSSRGGAVPRGGSGGGQRQQQKRRSETPSPQQLREGFAQRGASGGSGSCPYVIRTGDHAGQTCGKPHTQHRCFSRLDDAWLEEFGDEAERPRWAELLRSGVDIFALDYDAILAVMYALSISAAGDCYLCVPPDPCIEAGALGASECALPGTAPAEALHTFTLDSGASRCLHLPSFSTNLVSTAALQDAMVTTTTLGGQRVSIFTCTRTGRHLATFTRRPGSSLYTLATEPPQVATSAQVSASGQVAPPCSCRLLSHQTLLWHHRLGHPSLPRLRGMHSRLLVSGLPRSLPPLPPSPAQPCLPCVEGRQHATPHSSSFPTMSAPLQTLHMDVWGPARVSGQGRERYFLRFVDDYTCYTTVFSLRSKGRVLHVLISSIRAVRFQLRERFRQDLLVLRLDSDKGGEFSSNLLRDSCRGEGILQSFMLPAFPQQNGIAERRIGVVMEVARTSMIHASAPHFMWPFAVRYAAHQLNLWPRVSLPETSPTLRWTGKFGDASVFQFYHPASRRVLHSQDVTFDELVPFYLLFPYRSAPPPPPPLFLAPSPPPVDPLPPQGPAPSNGSQVDLLPGNVPAEVAVDSGAARGAASGGAASGGAEPAHAEPGGAEPAGAEPGGAESEGTGSGGSKRVGADPGGTELAGAEPRGAEPEGAEPRGAELVGAEFGGAEPRGTTSSGGPAGASPRVSPRPEPLSPQHLREWFAWRTRYDTLSFLCSTASSYAASS